MDRKRIIDVAAGREKADVVIKNTTVVDVLGGSLIKGDVAVCGDKFAGVGSYSGVTEIDGTGRYVMPSFYDAHLHFESVMVRPSEYLKISVPKGVTAYNADPHEIANVCGEKGIRFMLDDVRGIPADIRFMMPSCVPAAPEDHSGCVLGAADVKRIADSCGLFGLGEMMNFPGVVGCDPDVLAKLDVRPVIDGHAPGVSGNPLNAYIAAGVSTDHECESVEEALEKVSKGMYVLIREGSQTRNLRTLIKAVNKTNLRRFLFCTDDRNIEDLVGLGTIGNAVRLAVECGMDPIDAITIASLNANEAYGIKNTGAVAPGWTADFLVCADITAQRVEKVFYHGALVAENGQPLFSVSPADVSGVTGTVHIKPVTAKDMTFPFDPARPVMRVFPGTVVTEAVKADGPEGLNLMCCIERHDASGDIGHCYVDGFRLRGGAVAQTVGHDSHNITVLGDNPEDMALAVNSLGSDGGLVVVKNGRLIGKLPLEIAGLMSSAPASEALAAREKLTEALAEMDYNRDIEPFMLLSFLTLIVIPDVKLNHKGLFSVSKWDYLYRG
ncbi:MAG TPA: adenine deaminase [Firmicutes bacterium]|nr:adenine deaminase [Bacillota bacterium]